MKDKMICKPVVFFTVQPTGEVFSHCLLHGRFGPGDRFRMVPEGVTQV